LIGSDRRARGRFAAVAALAVVITLVASPQSGAQAPGIIRGLQPPTGARDSKPADYLRAPVRERQVLDWGHRPAWSPDGTKLAFVGLNHHFGAGYAYELDLRSGKVRCLTCDFENGQVLRVYYLPDGSFLLQAPATPVYSRTGVDTSIPEHFNCAILGREHQLGLPSDAVSEPFRCEVYWLPASLDSPPQPLGVYSFEEIAIANGKMRISWVVPSTAATPEFQIWTGQLVRKGAGVALVRRRMVFRSLPDTVTNPPAMAWIEVMDFFPADDRLLFYARIATDETGARGDGEVFELDLARGSLTNHSKHPSHEEAHLFFPHGRFALNERDGGLWALKLDGTGERTREFAQGIAAVSSPDGRRIAFNKETSGDGGLWIAEFGRRPARLA
jgi:hypothetical protein